MTKRIGDKAKAQGKITKVFTKRLRRRFAPAGVRNFSKYGRRAGAAFRSRKLVRQIMRLERMVDQVIRDTET